ncbi:hypothetical protein DMX30_16685 [Vibrio parahaemolyticus]|nr:hypothetical protein [Vibrio parahaemolyticus]
MGQFCVTMIYPVSKPLDKGEFGSRKQVSLKKGRLAVLIYCLMFPTAKRRNQDEPFVIKCV